MRQVWEINTLGANLFSLLQMFLLQMPILDSFHLFLLPVQFMGTTLPDIRAVHMNSAWSTYSLVEHSLPLAYICELWEMGHLCILPYLHAVLPDWVVPAEKERDCGRQTHVSHSLVMSYFSAFTHLVHLCTKCEGEEKKLLLSFFKLFLY